jgi:hypothetical protein
LKNRTRAKRKVYVWRGCGCLEEERKEENDGWEKRGWRRERESWNEKDARSHFRLSKYGKYVL